MKMFGSRSSLFLLPPVGTWVVFDAFRESNVSEQGLLLSIKLSPMPRRLHLLTKGGDPICYNSVI